VYVIENINDLTLAKNSYSSKNLIKEKTNRTRFSGLLTNFSPAEADEPALIYTWFSSFPSLSDVFHHK